MPIPLIPIGAAAAGAAAGWVARTLREQRKRSKREHHNRDSEHNNRDSEENGETAQEEARRPPGGGDRGGHRGKGAQEETEPDDREREQRDREQAKLMAELARVRGENEELARRLVRLQKQLDDATQEGSDTKDLLKYVEDEHRHLIDRVAAAFSGDEVAVNRELRRLVQDASDRQHITGVRDALIKFQAQWDESGRTPLVVVPAELRDSRAVAKLDKGSAAAVNGQRTHQALVALTAYAEDVERGTNQGRRSFQEWCQANPDYWSHHRVALSESESVQRDPKLRDQRAFQIDPSVNVSSNDSVGEPGRVYMGAHIKLKQGEHAPRLYFYDDTGVTSRGNPKQTGKVHVGYIGPHRPTKRFKN